MKVYLNAGFGEPLVVEDRTLIKSLGFAGIRTDILNNGHADTIAAGLKESGLEAIFMTPDVADVPLAVDAIRKQGFQSRVVVEVGNEPDFTAISAADLAAQIAAYVALYPDIQFVSGGVSHRGQNYLRQMIEAGLPESVIVGYHTYRNTPPETPLPGYPSRQAEFAELKAIAGGRRIWCTECGWHTARFGGIRIGPIWIGAQRFSDAQVADFVERELALHQAADEDVFVLYQLNDGPTDVAPNRYGIRRTDGTLKPVASVIAPYAPPPEPEPTPPPRQGIFWVGSTDFRLPQLQMAGQHDLFNAILAQRKAIGFNVLRVLGMKFDNTGWELNPDGRPDWEGDLRRFMEAAIAKGFKVEFNIFADTKHLPGWADSAKQHAHYNRTIAALRPFAEHVYLSLGNEVLHGGHQRLDVASFAKPDGFIFCRGSSLMDSPPVEPLGDYATYGVRRDALPDARGASNYSPYTFRADYPQPVPLIPTEGMKPENYGYDPEFARLIGRHAGCGWGGVFHHGRGINGELFNAQEEACARAFVEGIS
jgi:hypothetical protein